MCDQMQLRLLATTTGGRDKLASSEKHHIRPLNQVSFKSNATGFLFLLTAVHLLVAVDRKEERWNVVVIKLKTIFLTVACRKAKV